MNNLHCSASVDVTMSSKIMNKFPIVPRAFTIERKLIKEVKGVRTLSKPILKELKLLSSNIIRSNTRRD